MWVLHCNRRKKSQCWFITQSRGDEMYRPFYLVFCNLSLAAVFAQMWFYSLENFWKVLKIQEKANTSSLFFKSRCLKTRQFIVLVGILGQLTLPGMPNCNRVNRLVIETIVIVVTSKNSMEICYHAFFNRRDSSMVMALPLSIRGQDGVLKMNDVLHHDNKGINQD